MTVYRMFKLTTSVFLHSDRKAKGTTYSEFNQVKNFNKLLQLLERRIIQLVAIHQRYFRSFELLERHGGKLQAHDHYRSSNRQKIFRCNCLPYVNLQSECKYNKSQKAAQLQHFFPHLQLFSGFVWYCFRSSPVRFQSQYRQRTMSTESNYAVFFVETHTRFNCVPPYKHAAVQCTECTVQTKNSINSASGYLSAGSAKVRSGCSCLLALKLFTNKTVLLRPKSRG